MGKKKSEAELTRSDRGWSDATRPGKARNGGLPVARVAVGKEEEQRAGGLYLDSFSSSLGTRQTGTV